MDFLELADKAYRDRLREEEADKIYQQTQLEARTREQFARLTCDLIRPLSVFHNRVQVSEDRFILFMTELSLVYWLVIGRCPKCDEVTDSIPCKDLAHLGKQFVEFEPGRQHKMSCRACTQEEG